MKITFEGTVEEAFGEMVLFLSTMRGEGYLEASPPPAREQWLPAESKVAKVAGASRRREGSKKAEAAEEKLSLRRKGGGAKKAPAKLSEETLKDSDVTKAASEAAMKLTPARVQEIIASYDVKSVGDLDQDQRRGFIDTLEKLGEMKDA